MRAGRRGRGRDAAQRCHRAGLFGINVLILWGSVIDAGYPSQSWLTFRQAQEAGGCVRKGEHGVCVVYADRFTPGSERERAREAGEEARVVPFLKRFTVFNVAQCEGFATALCPTRHRCPNPRSCPSPSR
jgi:antirestriction protein ArdC